MAVPASAPASPARVPFAAVAALGGAVIVLGRFTTRGMFDFFDLSGHAVLAAGVVSAGLAAASMAIGSARLRTLLLGLAGLIGLIAFSLVLDLNLLVRWRESGIGPFLVMGGGLLAFAAATMSILRKVSMEAPADPATAVAAAAGGFLAAIGSFLGAGFRALDPDLPFGIQSIAFLVLGVAIAACAGGLLSGARARVRTGLAITGLAFAVIISVFAIHDGALL
jgi:hypothetical protein